MGGSAPKYPAMSAKMRVMTGFKPGDVVQLKSGGPKMTVKSVERHGAVTTDNARCVWFDGHQNIENVFDLTVIELVPSD